MHEFNFNNFFLGFLLIQVLPRSAAVDFTGCELNRNRLIALMSAIVLEEVSVISHSCHLVFCFRPESWTIYSIHFLLQHPGTTIVTDSVTSDGLTTFIEKKLGKGKFKQIGISVTLKCLYVLIIHRRQASSVQERLQKCHWWSNSFGKICTHLTVVIFSWVLYVIRPCCGSLLSCSMRWNREMKP